MRVGIIGTGRMAERHLAAYRAAEGVHVVAVAGRSDAHRDRFLGQGVERYHADPRELLDAGDLDAVSVATPSASHAALVSAALSAGCHVLCEKPLAGSVAEANALVREAEAARRHLMVGYVMRFFPEFIALKRRLDAGEIGEARDVWLRRVTPLPEAAWYRDPEQTGGVAPELAIHLIDLARWWMGSNVSRVSAVLRDDRLRLGRPDSAHLLLEFANGAVGSLTAAYGAPAGRDAGVAGSRGVLQVEAGRVVPEREPEAAAGGDPFGAQVAQFVRGIQDDAPPAADGVEGLLGLAVVEAAQWSQEQGCAVAVRDVLSRALPVADLARYAK